MSHYRRYYLPGGTYFFTLVTYQRRRWFNDESHVVLLREAFRRTLVKRPAVIDAVVVLPDHLHCIWRMPPGDADFSSCWREIKKYVSKHVSRERNCRGESPVWQRRFWEHLIRDENDWQRHVDYIHYNPVKHGLVMRPVDWPWSSFHRWLARGVYDSGWGASEPSGIVTLDCE